MTPTVTVSCLDQDLRIVPPEWLDLEDQQAIRETQALYEQEGIAAFVPWERRRDD